MVVSERVRWDPLIWPQVSGWRLQWTSPVSPPLWPNGSSCLRRMQSAGPSPCHMGDLRTSWVGLQAPSDGWAGSADLAVRDLPAEISLLLARSWTSEGESCAWGPCPFLAEQRVTLVWWRFTGTLFTWPWCDSRIKDLTPRSLQQLTTPLPYLSWKRALLKALGEFGVF